MTGVPVKSKVASSLASGKRAIAIWYLIERLLLGDLGLQQIADNLGHRVLPLQPGGEDLVERGAHAGELQLVHHLDDLVALHHTARRRLS